MSNSITVSIGSNSADRAAQVARCLAWLQSTLNGCRQSGVYATAALNGHGGDYMNAVASGECTCSLAALNEQFKSYERQCGRDADCRASGIVPIDLDIVVWNGEVVRPADYAQQYFQKGWHQICG